MPRGFLVKRYPTKGSILFFLVLGQKNPSAAWSCGFRHPPEVLQVQFLTLGRLLWVRNGTNLSKNSHHPVNVKRSSCTTGPGGNWRQRDKDFFQWFLSPYKNLQEGYKSPLLGVSWETTTHVPLPGSSPRGLYFRRAVLSLSYQIWNFCLQSLSWVKILTPYKIQK